MVMDRRVLAAVLGSGYGGGGNRKEGLSRARKEKKALITAFRKEYE